MKSERAPAMTATEKLHALEQEQRLTVITDACDALGVVLPRHRFIGVSDLLVNWWPMECAGNDFIEGEGIPV
jgi:hypothetical protein